MTEEDIKLKFITPALQKAGWNIDNQINMEFPVKKEYFFTTGRILLDGEKIKRGTRKRADYLLSYQNGFPLAIIEAKDDNHQMNHGLQQAQEYAKMLDIPFAYSSNGKGFVEFDFFTGRTTELALDEFPTPQQLFLRFTQGKNLDNPEQIALITTPFDTYRKPTPRYYQINAVNRTIEAVANNQKRILLVMATGTGKTFTAAQIAHRLLQAKKAKHILYLADRNSLIEQTMKGDFKHFQGTTQISGKSFDPAFQIHFGLYQQFVEIKGENEIADYLTKNPNKKHLVREEIVDETSGEKEYIIEHYKEFAPDFFDTIFIDECHRSSRRANSQWRKILEYYANAVQIGMTATPKDDKTGSNLSYFGSPVYTYSLKQGIDDGFLAPYKVIRFGTNIDNFGYRPEQGKTDKVGNIIEDKEYTTTDFNRIISIDERNQIVAKTISHFLKNRLNDRFARTIVFCDDQDEAAKMRDCLGNENSDLQAKYNGEYVVRITSSEDNAQANLDKFNSVSERNLMPIIATTSHLMRTGVDSKLAKVIVFNCSVGSISEFKQMIGRGTRIDEDNGKTYFTILDFKGVTRLFADPAFDGEPEPEPEGNFPKQKRRPQLDASQRKINVNGVEVTMDSEMEYILDANGKLISTNFTDYTRTNFCGKYPDLKDFLNDWKNAKNKSEFLQLLESKGILIEEIKKYDQFKDMDEFDILISLAYGANALSRSERAKKAGKILDKFTGQAREVLQKLLDKYEQNGIDELEDLTHTLQNEPFNFMDIPFHLNQIFSTGNDDGFDIFIHTIDEIKTAIYADELEAA